MQHETSHLSFLEQLVLLAMKEAQGKLTIQTLQTLCKVHSRRSLQRALKSLVDKKILKMAGTTYQVYYCAGENPCK